MTDANQTYCGDHFAIYTNVESLCLHLKLLYYYMTLTSQKKESGSEKIGGGENASLTRISKAVQKPQVYT